MIIPIHITIEAFKAAMCEAGITPPDIIVTDTIKPQRFHVINDRNGSKNGWYILYTDFPPAGAFGCWKRSIGKKFCPPIQENNVTARIQQSERIDFINRQVSREKEKQTAIAIWESATLANDNARYLRTKRIKSHGLRYYQNALLVPVMDIHGTIHGVQRIWPDGAKRFITGTDKRSHFFVIGNPGDTILIAEGYATAATLHEITDHAAVVAFDAANMLTVSIALKAYCPDAQIVLCADNDMWTEGNPGLTAATAAATKTNGLLAVPMFGKTACNPTDFNDLYCLEGADVVREQVAAASEVVA
jgi:putative DNA primase/helicase